MEFKKIKLPFKIKNPVLALGSQVKNTVCFLENNLALMSPVHLDLSDPKDYQYFTKTVSYFLKKRPKLVAHDLHPGYISTQYAFMLQATGYRLQGIQHHHAHIASCMLGNGLKNQKVVGLAFDGTGWGSDNRLWGAEFLVCDYKGFKRMAHLAEVPLLGGEKAIVEPWRVAAAWLYLIYKDRFLDLDIGFSKKIKKKKWQVLKNMYACGFNTPLASSMGRLFDAAASLILEKERALFEAELAIELEKLAVSSQLSAVSSKFKIIKNKEIYILDPGLMFKDIAADLKAKKPKNQIALRFHLTVAEMIKKVCLLIRRKTKINKIILSGGVFQNRLLSNLALNSLTQEDFSVFIHKGMPCNDSALSLGQACVANFQN